MEVDVASLRQRSLPEVAAAMVAAGGFGYALGRFMRGLGKLEVAGGEGIPVELGWFALENSLKEMGANPFNGGRRMLLFGLHGCNN